MEDALDHAPVFRKKLVRSPLDLDNPYWVDDPYFSLDFHIRHLALPKPGNWRQLCIQLARLLSRPLDINRPLWEMYVIEGLNNVEGLPEGAFAVVFKIQHSMVDGMGFANLINSILDDSPVPPERVTKREKWVPQPGPTTLEMAGKSWLHAVRRPWQFSARAAKLGTGLFKQALAPKEVQSDGERKRKGVPKTILNGTITPSRVYDCAIVSLAEVKQMRRLAEGATVNDVVLAIVGGTLRRYLSAKQALPEESLVSAVPISTRSEKSKDQSTGNEMSAETVELFTDIADPVERLGHITKAMHRIKTAPNAMGVRAIMDLTADLPGSVTGMLMRGMEAVGNATGKAMLANTLVTNVPGMIKPMYMLGAKLIVPIGGGPCINNMGVIHLVSSYCEKFTITVVGCQSLLPDPDFYMQCLRESYAEYAGFAGASVPVKKSKK
jgi:diacylglycerol O-acyltransferase / wax synthase